MMHKMEVSDPWFAYIQNRRKIYEGRRWWPKTKDIHADDFICFWRSGYPKETCIKRVKQVHVFPSFAKALQTLGLEYILPDVETIEEGVKIYRKFVSQATEEKEGICMIELLS